MINLYFLPQQILPPTLTIHTLIQLCLKTVYRLCIHYRNTKSDQIWINIQEIKLIMGCKHCKEHEPLRINNYIDFFPPISMPRVSVAQIGSVDM